MANIDAICWVISTSINLLFLKSDYSIICKIVFHFCQLFFFRANLLTHLIFEYTFVSYVHCCKHFYSQLQKKLYNAKMKMKMKKKCRRKAKIKMMITFFFSFLEGSGPLALPPEFERFYSLWISLLWSSILYGPLHFKAHTVF